MTISNWVPNYDKYNEYLETVSSVYFEGFNDEEEEYFKHVREVNELIDFEGYLKNSREYFYDPNSAENNVLEYIVEVKNIVIEDFDKYTKEIEIGILKDYYDLLTESYDNAENDEQKNFYHECMMEVHGYLPSFDSDDVLGFLYNYEEKNGKFNTEFIPRLMEIMREDAPGIIDMWDECLYDFIEDFINR